MNDVKRRERIIEEMDMEDSTAFKCHFALLYYFKDIELPILLDFLLEKEKQHIIQEELTEDGMFPVTAYEANEVLLLKESKYLKMTKILEMDGFIITDLRGLPMKKYYKINHKKIENIFKKYEESNG